MTCFVRSFIPVADRYSVYECVMIEIMDSSKPWDPASGHLIGTSTFTGFSTATRLLTSDANTLRCVPSKGSNGTPKTKLKRTILLFFIYFCIKLRNDKLLQYLVRRGPSVAEEMWAEQNRQKCTREGIKRTMWRLVPIKRKLPPSLQLTSVTFRLLDSKCHRYSSTTGGKET